MQEEERSRGNDQTEKLGRVSSRLDFSCSSSSILCRDVLSRYDKLLLYGLGSRDLFHLLHNTYLFEKGNFCSVTNIGKGVRVKPILRLVRPVLHLEEKNIGMMS